MDIYKTDTITTHLVLQLKTGTLRVQSDRSFLHHEVIDGQLRICIPEDGKRRQACFRTQLPKLLTSITGTGPTAVHDISTILLSNLRDLDDILIEQDISEVSWTEKPVTNLSDLEEDEPSSLKAASPEQNTKSGTNFEADPETFSGTESDADAGIVAPRRTIRASSERSLLASPPALYRDIIEQIVRSAQRTPDRDNIMDHLDCISAFGIREVNEYAYNRKVGAAGEAFVFELLSTLNLPQFTRENWQSTIRGELAVHPRYADLEDWNGRETADLVYMDRNGFLTQYLRKNCDGGFPIQIPESHDHARYPIEYYLEVKSTPGMCNARFFMSNSQYKLMEDMAIGLFQPPKRVYVILRVYDLTEPNVRLKSFVDPWRLRGTILDFSSKQWVGKTR